MESSGGDHGRGLKPLQPWTTTATTTTTPAAGHSFSIAAGCFPWPPPLPSSCYTCGYCRREFRSAQALGGHMNVHRRDRARLRQCCSAAAHGRPSSSLPSPSLQMAAHHQHTRAPPPPVPNLNFSRPHRAADPVIYTFFSATTTSSAAATAAAATNKAAALEVSLELGIGVCGSGSGRGGGGVVVEEDGLDLELRLGCACWE